MVAIIASGLHSGSSIVTTKFAIHLAFYRSGNLELHAAAAQSGAIARTSLREHGSINLVRGADHSFGSIPAYRALTYRAVYPGIEMMFEGDDGRLRYGFVLDPDALVERIRIATARISSLEIDHFGNLLMKTPSGTLGKQKPRSRSAPPV
jgi:hypothetical protein